MGGYYRKDGKRKTYWIFLIMILALQKLFARYR
jgi:hypothetical protein